MLGEIITSQEEKQTNEYLDRLAMTLMEKALFVSELKHQINTMHEKKVTIPEERLVSYVKTALLELIGDEALQLSVIKRKKRTHKVNLTHLARAILTRGTEQREQLITRTAQLTIKQKLL